MRPSPLMTGLLFTGIGVYFLGLPALILGLSGDWRWVEGWIFGVWFSGFFAVSMFWLYYKDPELLAERLRRPGSGGESRADLAILIGVKVGSIAWVVLPALDKRFGWTPRLPLWSEACGGVLFLAGNFFMFRSLADNTFLSQLVRIQAERGHRVIDTGVYGFVRHPMYLGAALLFVGGALLLGSVYGLLVGIGLILLMVLRILGEEKLLAGELEGYQAYRERVRYRLAPHVW